MQTTRQMTVARRLALGFGLLILLTLAMAALGTWGKGQGQAALKKRSTKTGQCRWHNWPASTTG